MTNGNTAGNGNGNTATTPLTGNNNPPNVNETIDLLSFPETSHLSDEIFFNNYQFNNQLGSDSTNNNAFLSQQQQEQQQFLYNQQSQLQPPPPPQQQQDQRINQINSATSAHSFDNELTSNISSNSLNTYFQIHMLRHQHHHRRPRHLHHCRFLPVPQITSTTILATTTIIKRHQKYPLRHNNLSIMAGKIQLQFQLIN